MKKIELTINNLIIISIIVVSIIFLCSFSIVNNIKKIKLEKFVSEMNQIQEKVNSIKIEYTVWDLYNPNESGNFLEYIKTLGFSNANSSSNTYIDEYTEIIKKLNNENTKYWDSDIDSILSNYCYFTSDNLSKYLKINNSNLNVIINFYTGNIITKDGIQDITNKNQIIYRQYDTKLCNKLAVSNLNSKLKTEVEVVENNGLSQKVKVSFNSNENTPNILEIFYYDENENKKKCSSLKDYIYIKEENSAYFTINETGKYYFFIKGTNYIEYPRNRGSNNTL